MLNILLFVINLIEQQILWVYISCGAIILWHIRNYALARRARLNTIFTIEREVAAHREGQAMSSIGVFLGIAVVMTAVKFYVLPTIDIQEIVEPTPTVVLSVPTALPTATLTATALPSPTPRPRATSRPEEPTAAPTATLAPPPACADPNIQILAPGMGAVVAGRVELRGSALHPQFQFYKVEIGVGDTPSAWHSISDTHNSPVSNGVLDAFDTRSVPNGVYWFRLTVVDQTGNFPKPCDVRVTIQN